jgi:predicted ArsR family transcriptional regulator
VSDVLQCLKKHGQRLDLEIAEETRVPLAAVRERLSELSAAGRW